MTDGISDGDRAAWLTLASFPGFGSRTLAKLRKRYGLRAAAMKIPLTDLEPMGHRADVIAHFAEFRRHFDVKRARKRMNSEKMRFVLIDDGEYPPLLRQIADPPVALFVRGTFPDPGQIALAIVGTRAFTSYGKRVTREFAHDLAAAGLTIVSGLALGIDAVAHEATLDANGACIAVLGSGSDDATLYPRSNLQLAHRILRAGGAVISEFPPGTESLKHHFPLRNRIIAGLARATLVTEAAMGSGSLITAHLAASYNRDVFAIPGPVTSVQSAGTNHLISQGAMLCASPQDILTSFNTGYVPTIPSCRLDALDEEDRVLLAALDEPQRINDLARTLKRDIRGLQQRITSLELHGFVETQSGQFIARSRLVSTAVH